MLTNDRFLAKDQTTGTQKGFYQWNGSGVAATRTLDADLLLPSTNGIATVVQDDLDNTYQRIDS